MIIAGLIVAILATLLHVFIFSLESLAWTSARARATFGLTLEEAQATKEMAFNQGFYNLFLGVLAALGAVLYSAGSHTAGLTLAFAGVGPMLAAALVLFLSSPGKRGAAIKQGTLPFISIVLLIVGLALA